MFPPTSLTSYSVSLFGSVTISYRYVTFNEMNVSLIFIKCSISAHFWNQIKIISLRLMLRSFFIRSTDIARIHSHFYVSVVRL